MGYERGARIRSDTRCSLVSRWWKVWSWGRRDGTSGDGRHWISGYSFFTAQLENILIRMLQCFGRHGHFGWEGVNSLQHAAYFNVDQSIESEDGFELLPVIIGERRFSITTFETFTILTKTQYSKPAPIHCIRIRALTNNYEFWWTENANIQIIVSKSYLGVNMNDKWRINSMNTLNQSQRQLYQLIKTEGVTEIIVFNKSVKNLWTGCDKIKRTTMQWTKSEQKSIISRSFWNEKMVAKIIVAICANIRATKLKALSHSKW